MQFAAAGVGGQGIMVSLAAAAVKMLPSLLDLLRPGWIIGVMGDGGHDACAVW